MTEVATEAQNEMKTDEIFTDEAKKIIEATEGPLKGMLVDYVGKALTPEDGKVTVEMIVQTLASEFPEFLFVVARENFLRGYEQALMDVENVEKERQEGILEEQKKSQKKTKKKAKKK
jgi:hypothetical protein